MGFPFLLGVFGERREREREGGADGLSYDAAEDNEISFKEGEKISQIEKVDTDWWQGQAGGKVGLFPGQS